MMARVIMLAHFCLKIHDVGKKILTYGENNYSINAPNSIHSEIDAIKKLKRFRHRGKRLKSLDMIVIRINNSGTKLGASKLCEKCIIGASTMPQKYGYKINNVYYSNSDGTLTKTTLSQLIHSNDYHISRYYRENGYNSYLSKMCSHNL